MMDLPITFFVPGIARPGGSKTAAPNSRFGVRPAGKYTKTWMDKVSVFAMKEVGERTILLSGAIRLELTFVMVRANGDYGTGKNAGCLRPSAPFYHLKAPDLTKLTRATEDALTKIVWEDDKQVVQQETEKRYCRGKERPGVWITITEPVSKGNHYVREEEGSESDVAVHRQVDRHDGGHQPINGGLSSGQNLFNEPVTQRA